MNIMKADSIIRMLPHTSSGHSLLRSPHIQGRKVTPVSALHSSSTACAANVDMAFVIDMSGSVRIQGFRQSVRFAADIATSFRIGQNATRVALITYSTTPVLNFDFLAHNTSEQIRLAFLAAPYAAKATHTAAAIYKMIRSVFILNTSSAEDTSITTAPPAPTVAPITQPRPTLPCCPLPDFAGGGDIPALPGPTTAVPVPPTVTPIQLRTRVGIVITDGRAQDDVEPPSMLAHSLGITMFSIGVGNAVQRELNEIATDPNSAHVYRVGDYSIIENIRSSIRQRSCRGKNLPAVKIVSPTGHNNYCCRSWF